MTVIKRHPVDRPSISQPFANLSNRGTHLGIDYRPDFPGQTNFPVYAAHAGFVVFARETAHEIGNPWEQIPGNGNNGRSVIVQAAAPHQASATSYNHLGTIAVREGQWVEAGTFLGYMGWSGFVIGAWGWNGWATDRNPSGTHLHFELFIDYGNGQYPAGTSYGRVNPLDYFDKATITPIAPGGSGGGSTITKPPAPNTPQKDWFDMASREDLKSVLTEVLKESGLIEDAVRKVLADPKTQDQLALAVLKRDNYLVDPTGKSGKIVGTTTLAKKINWMAHNDALLKNILVAMGKKLGLQMDDIIEEIAKLAEIPDLDVELPALETPPTDAPTTL